MLDPRNLINISGFLVDNPEYASENNKNIMKARIGVQYAGSEQNSDNNSGFFDITYYIKSKNANGHVSQNAKFFEDQVSAGNMKKGSSITVVGRLLQERWKNQEGKGASRVVIIAEHIGYGPYTKSEGSSSSSSSSSSSDSAQASVPSSF